MLSDRFRCRIVGRLAATTLSMGHVASLVLGCAAGLALMVAALPASADPLDGVPLDTRARLAVAASAYSFEEAPELDPSKPGFKPNAAAGYLTTNAEGLYTSGANRNGVDVTYTLVRFPDAKEAAAALKAWGASAAPTAPLDWGGSFQAFWRPESVMGIVLSGRGLVTRGQSGRWHFEVSAKDSRNDDKFRERELAAAAAAMRLLADNGKRYRIFPRELVIEYQVADRKKKRLEPGERFRLPLDAGQETQASFQLQLTEDGKPLQNVNYTVKLLGAMTDFAELDQNGTREPRKFVEVQSAGGEPVTLTWVFPPTTASAVAPVVDKGDTNLSISIKAQQTPTVLP